MGLVKKLSEHGKWIDVDVDQRTDWRFNSLANGMSIIPKRMRLCF
jgi:hypothetical protein